MLRLILQLLVIALPCYYSTSVTLPTKQLFVNTLKRWGIAPTSNQDKLERWTRFVKARDIVEKTTSNILLDSLNLFTVLNDKEYRDRVKPLLQGSNITDIVGYHYNSSPRRRHKRSMPTTFNYWEEEVGLTTPKDQGSCGACWSFPTVGTIEVLNKHLTGDDTAFSEQYFVDCTFDHSGCGGGEINDGYKITLERQYMMKSTDWPFTADYQACPFTDDIENNRNNAMDKIWVQDWVPLNNNEDAMLTGLQISPVAFGAMISENIFAYSGGRYRDTLCLTAPLPHAMLLVGYTERILRVKASYGTVWGDYGFINYDRGDTNLANCNFFNKAFAVTATFRRDVEYEYCNDKKVSTYSACKASCEAMNTNTKTGWGLASIPTKMHNQQVVDMVSADYPGVKIEDKFNYLWIGLDDNDQDGSYTWPDGTPTNYLSVTSGSQLEKKYGLINKNSGVWITKNSLTFEARGLCSRIVNCWNIERAIIDGTVSYSNNDRVEGTVATVTCNQGVLVGDQRLECVGGSWNKELPTCSIGGTCRYNGEAGTKATPSPEKHIFGDGEKLTITCDNGRSTDHTCTNGVFTPGIAQCTDTDSRADCCHGNVILIMAAIIVFRMLY